MSPRGSHRLPGPHRRATVVGVLTGCLSLAALLAAVTSGGADPSEQPSIQSSDVDPAAAPAAVRTDRPDRPSRGRGQRPTDPPSSTDPADQTTDTSSTTADIEPSETGTETPPQTDPGDEVFGPESGSPFADDSPFNLPIGPNVTVDPNSSAMVDVLAGRGYATAQVYADTPPIYNATESTPRYSINCTESWGTCDLERMRVPIPAGAVSADGHDRNMVVIDWSSRQAFEFWKYDNNTSTAAWGAVCSIDGSGTGTTDSDPCRYGAVGAGISRLAGVIRTYEIRQGEINHALVGPTGFSCKGSYRYPAVKSDGWSTAAGCIPEGARVQLDPAVDCDTIAGIPDWEVAVCEALQTYGWYNIDNGNVGVEGFGIQFENPAGEDDPYAPIGLRDYTQINHIPLDRLRVLAE